MLEYSRGILRYINVLHTNKTTTQNYLKRTISDFKPISFKTYFGSRIPRLLHVFSLNTMLKFHKYSKTKNTCIAEPHEAREGGGGHKMSGMEGGENWSKLCSLGGRVSSLVLILERET